jgi:hypothetical protein
MIRLLESFSPYATAQLPASEKWTSATAVTVVQGGGRSGEAGDNCAVFDTALGSALVGPLAIMAYGGYEKATWGHAVKIAAVSGRLTLGSLSTTLSRFDLVMNEKGALWVEQSVGGVLLGVVCQTVDGVIPRVTGGTYIEMRVLLRAAYNPAVQLRVRDQWGQMNPLVQGRLLAFVTGESFTLRALGGGTADDAAQWSVADVYYTDGVPEATALAYNGTLIYNDGYLGDTHVEALYPTADGEHLSTGNTPWVPASGSVEFNQINEHPPDEDATYVSADTSGQTSTYAFVTPRQTAPIRFGRVGCTANAQPIYGIQWGGRLRSEATEVLVAPIVRQIVDGTFAGDDIYQASPVTVALTTYAYLLAIFGRNPISGEPWTFAVFFRQAATLPGDVEFGQRLL